MNKNTHDTNVYCPKLTEMAKKGDVDVQNLMEDLGSSQCYSLDYWLEQNGINRIRIDAKDIVAKISGMVTIADVEVCELSIELVMWNRAKRSYSQDYAQFLRNKVGGDTRGEIRSKGI